VFVGLEREQIDQGLIADDHAGGVDRRVAGEVFEHKGGVNEFAGGAFLS
jgi:hypothetical protein